MGNQVKNEMVLSDLVVKGNGSVRASVDDDQHTPGINSVGSSISLQSTAESDDEDILKDTLLQSRNDYSNPTSSDFGGKEYCSDGPHYGQHKVKSNGHKQVNDRNKILVRISDLGRQLIENITDPNAPSQGNEVHTVLVAMEEEWCMILDKLKELTITPAMKTMAVADITRKNNFLQKEIDDLKIRGEKERSILARQLEFKNIELVATASECNGWKSKDKANKAKILGLMNQLERNEKVLCDESGILESSTSGITENILDENAGDNQVTRIQDQSVSDQIKTDDNFQNIDSESLGVSSPITTSESILFSNEDAAVLLPNGAAVCQLQEELETALCDLERSRQEVQQYFNFNFESQETYLNDMSRLTAELQKAFLREEDLNLELMTNNANLKDSTAEVQALHDVIDSLRTGPSGLLKKIEKLEKRNSRTLSHFGPVKSDSLFNRPTSPHLDPPFNPPFNPPSSCSSSNSSKLRIIKKSQSADVYSGVLTLLSDTDIPHIPFDEFVESRYLRKNSVGGRGRRSRSGNRSASASDVEEDLVAVNGSRFSSGNRIETGSGDGDGDEEVGGGKDDGSEEGKDDGKSEYGDEGQKQAKGGDDEGEYDQVGEGEGEDCDESYAMTDDTQFDRSDGFTETQKEIQIFANFLKSSEEMIMDISLASNSLFDYEEEAEIYRKTMLEEESVQSKMHEESDELKHQNEELKMWLELAKKENEEKEEKVDELKKLIKEEQEHEEEIRLKHQVDLNSLHERIIELERELNDATDLRIGGSNEKCKIIKVIKALQFQRDEQLLEISDLNTQLKGKKENNMKEESFIKNIIGNNTPFSDRGKNNNFDINNIGKNVTDEEVLSLLQSRSEIFHFINNLNKSSKLSKITSEEVIQKVKTLKNFRIEFKQLSVKNDENEKNIFVLENSIEATITKNGIKKITKLKKTNDAKIKSLEHVIEDTMKKIKIANSKNSPIRDETMSFDSQRRSLKILITKRIQQDAQLNEMTRLVKINIQNIFLNEGNANKNRNENGNKNENETESENKTKSLDLETMDLEFLRTTNEYNLELTDAKKKQGKMKFDISECERNLRYSVIFVRKEGEKFIKCNIDCEIKREKVAHLLSKFNRELHTRTAELNLFRKNVTNCLIGVEEYLRKQKAENNTINKNSVNEENTEMKPIENREKDKSTVFDDEISVLISQYQLHKKSDIEDSVGVRSQSVSAVAMGMVI
jgi:hypothetical protein